MIGSINLSTLEIPHYTVKGCFVLFFSKHNAPAIDNLKQSRARVRLLDIADLNNSNGVSIKANNINRFYIIITISKFQRNQWQTLHTY